MKHRLHLILISFLMVGTLWGSESILIGDWEGTHCGSYNDSTSIGTYNWNFTSNTVNTYIQYHTTFACNDPTFKSNQANGVYKLEKNNNSYADYTLTVQFSHLSFPLIFNVVREGDTLVMTNIKSGPGYRLTRKTRI